MTEQQLDAILKALKEHYPNGQGVISLSMETGIEQSELRKYLKANPDYFIRRGSEERYLLNRFGPFQGETQAILEHYQQVQQRPSKSSNFLLWFFASALFILFVNLMSKNPPS